MKASILTLILFFSCLSFVSAQKFRTKIIMLDNEVAKGLLYHVDEKGIYILPNKFHWKLMDTVNNKPSTIFLDYRFIKQIYLRRKGMVGLGILLGLGTSFFVGKAVSDKQNSLTGLAMFYLILPIGPLTGGIIGSSSKKFDVKKDSTSIQKLKTKLKKYEWYHAEEGMVQ